MTSLFVIGYPTSIFGRIRAAQARHATEGKSDHGPEGMDKVIFWLNFIGIYHDDSKETKAFFYLPFLYMYVALLFERLCILWLTNRLGCGYREIQKFTELETRQEFIKA